MLLVSAVCVSEGMRVVRELLTEIAKRATSPRAVVLPLLQPPYIGPERRVSADQRPWVGGRRASDKLAMIA